MNHLFNWLRVGIFSALSVLSISLLLVPTLATAAVSPFCPTQSLTVAKGGAVVSADLAACDGPFNIGLAPLIGQPNPFPTTHGTVTIGPQSGPGTQTLTYSHNGDTATSDTFLVEDENGDTLTFNVTITPPASAIVVSPAALPTLTAGTAFSQTLTSAGGVAPFTYTLSSGTLPLGLTLTSAGVLSGTPTQRGTYSFNVRSQDSLGAFVIKGYTGSVQNPTLSLVAGSGTAIQNVAFTQTLSTNGGVTPHGYLLETGTFPAGIIISSAGVISGTTAAAPGNYPVTLRVTDASTGPGSYFELEPYTLTVSSPPSVSIAVSPASVSEDGVTNLTFTVTRSLNLSSPTTVNIATGGTATSGTDYTGGVATVTIPAGSTTATIIINPSTDSTVEPDETVTLAVAAGTGYTVGAPASATGTILNDDVPTATITVSPAAVAEDGAPTLVYTVTLNQAPASALSVNFTISGTATNGTDYAAITSPLIIPAGNTTGTITVNPTADATIEADETVTITLAAGSGYTVGAPNSATGTILNDDLPNLTINDVTASEGNAGTTNFIFTVSLSAPAGPGGVTFDIATASGTATAGTDYTANTLTGQTIPAGSSTYTFTVLVNGDTLNEPNDTFFVNVTNVTGATVVDGQGVGTITNDDPLPSLSINDVTVVEGNSGAVNAVFTVTLNVASGQTVSVNYATADGTATQPADYANSSGSLTFAPGQTTRTITVPVVGDTVPETNETFFVNLSGATNATISDNQGLGTIGNDDVPITVNPATLPGTLFNSAYNQTITATGGTGPYSFGVTAGTLPTGLTLTAGGALTGNATAGGTFNFTVTATDSSPIPGPFIGSRAYSVVVSPIAQTVTFAPTSPVAFGVAPIALTATASSGLTAFIYSTTSAATICTVSGSNVTIVGVGTCALTASQAGNANYNSATANANIVINPANQTITFSPASPVTVGAAPIALTATATSGLTAFTYSTTSAATICTVSGSTLTIVGGGTCALTATQAGNANYNSASGNANVVINPANQTVTFAPASPVTFGVAPINLTATASSGLTTFTFATTSAATICTVSGSTLTITGGGTCVLSATQPGNTSFSSATTSANVVINAATQTVTFAPATPVTFGASPVALSATASSGLTNFVFSTTSAATICTVSGSTVTFVGGGSCALTATQPGNASYISASANASIVINVSNQTVTFAPASPVVFGVAPIALTATASSGLTAFTFATTSAATICTVSGSTLTVVGAGTCVLSATQPGNSSFGTATASANVVINPATQTVTFTPASPVTVGAAPIALTATASSGLTAFIYSTTSAATICTVSGSTLTIVGGGTCALTATQAGNANYTSASANASVLINVSNQTVTFAPASPVLFGAAPITLTATSTSGLTAFNFATTSSTSICTVSGDTLTITGVGTCALTATQPGDASYSSATTGANVVINPIAPGAPTIGAGTAGNAQASVAFTAPTSNGGAAITGYTVSCGAGLTATGATSPLVVSGLTNGTTYICSVIATNSVGNSAASATVAVTPSFASFTGTSPTGTGPITASFTGAGPGCTFTTSQFIPVSGHPASPPTGTAPNGVTFPHGLFDFVASGCTPGGTLTMTVTYPSALPANTQYWKYGPTPNNATPSWYVLPATISGATATFNIVDGGLGDDDLQANGSIVDQGGPGVSPALPVPLSPSLLLLLALSMATVTALRMKRVIGR